MERLINDPERPILALYAGEMNFRPAHAGKPGVAGRDRNIVLRSGCCNSTRTVTRSSGRELGRQNPTKRKLRSHSLQ